MGGRRCPRQRQTRSDPGTQSFRTHWGLLGCRKGPVGELGCRTTCGSLFHCVGSGHMAIHLQVPCSRKASASRRQRKSPGYSLIEIAITLGIAALLLGISLAGWGGGIRERRVVRAAEDLAGLLRFAQQAAVADAADSCLYRVVVTAAQAEARKVARAASGGCTSPEVVATVRVTDQFSQGVVVVTTTVEFTSAGRLNGSTPVSINVSSGGRTRYVHVESGTGRVGG